ncbi:unnamed protein product, partial [Closterium sp. NIES-53]
EQQPPNEPPTTTSSPPFSPPFPSHLTLCLPPLHGPSISPRALLEFLSYHHLIGITSFLLYNAGGATDPIRAVIQAQAGQGRAELVEMTGLLEREQLWNHGQVPALQDCLYRSRMSARWVLYLDLDDYLWLPPVTEPRPLPPLHILLETYDAGNSVTAGSALTGRTGGDSSGRGSGVVAAAGDTSLSGWGDGSSSSSTGGSSSTVAGITFGSLWFSIHLCRPRADHEIEVLGLPDPSAPGMAAGGDTATAGGVDAGGGRLWRGGVVRDKKVAKEWQWGGERAGEMQVERFVFHWPEPACHDNEKDGERIFDPSLCPGEQGHRKFIVDPRRHERPAAAALQGAGVGLAAGRAVGHTFPSFPSHPSLPPHCNQVDSMGVFGPIPSHPTYPRMAHLSTSDLQLLHYRELGSGAAQGVCDEPTPRWRTVGWWHTDASYARSIAALRQRAQCNFTSGGVS